ncbi:MAG: UbiA family prenyltransferase, partial [Bacteroidota bacterium]
MIKTWRDIEALFRLSAIAPSMVLPMLGSASVSPDLSLYQLAGIGMIGFNAHIFGYVLNDVIDLPLDRTEPRKKNHPLVRGSIATKPALLFALIQAPMAMSIAAIINFDIASLSILVTSFLLVILYNTYGKKTSFPIFFDLILGVSASLFVIFGAFIEGHHINQTTAIISFYSLIYITSINSIHGGIRDIENDAKCNSITTPIKLGVHLDENNTII